VALSRPLFVAIVAGVALAVSIGVDATINRTYHLSVQENGGWRELASDPYTATKAVPFGPDAVVAGPNDNVTFQLRVENGYPWAASASWEARVNGVSYARGTLDAPGRGEGEATFSIPAKVWWSNGAAPEPKPVGARNTTFGSIEVVVAGHALGAGFTLTEAPS